MTESRLKYLLNRYIDDECSHEEEDELMTYLAREADDPVLQVVVDEFIHSTGPAMQLSGRTATSILQNILHDGKEGQAQPKVHRPVLKLWKRLAAASVVFIAGFAFYYLFWRKDDSVRNVAAAQQMHPILPGGNKAILKISSGPSFFLDSIRDGSIIHSGTARISKIGGLIKYDASSVSDPGTPVVYNTLITPRGGQYQVVLPDGSNVWLNAASSLYFPSKFGNGRREVVLTGEAYFEVAKDKAKPFLVKVGDMQVKVLGTHFNIKAYPEEGSIKTSLLEGSVNINKDGISAILAPGEQATLKNQQDNLKIARVDMDAVTAWRSGLFQFVDADIATVMREIGRWYDVRVVYAGEIPKRRFDGKISRKVQLNDVLRILELSDVKFSVADNTITVL